jgi:hypothetical protein
MLESGLPAQASAKRRRCEEQREMNLLRCPRCGVIYENTPAGEDRTRGLTGD